MTISRRLFLVLAIPLGTMLGFSVLTFINSVALEKDLRLVAEVQIESLAEIGKFSRLMESRRITVRQIVLSDDPDVVSQSKALMSATRGRADAVLSAYAERLLTGDMDTAYVRDLQALVRQWDLEADRVLGMYNRGERETAEAMLSSELVQLGNRIQEVVNDWTALNVEIGKAAGEHLMEQLGFTRSVLRWATVLGIGFSAVFGLLVVRSISRPLALLKGRVESIAAGDFDAEVPGVRSADEIGVLARSIDVLKEGAGTAAQQHWVKGNVARIAGVVQNTETVEDFGRRLLSEFTPLIGAGVSALYVAESERSQLVRAASFGLAEGASAEPVAFGQGLVGQCAAERAMVSLTDLPPDYLRIGSGLGSAPPKFVWAWPLVVNEVVVGVLEVASFTPMSPRTEAFIGELLPVVALSLDVLRRNILTRELLETTQRQSAEVAVREEQFRTLLEATPDALVISDSEGRIMLVNAQTERLFGYSRKELIGQSIDMLVPERFRGHHAGLRGQYYENPNVRAMGATSDLYAVRKDGSEFAVEISLSPIQTTDGRGIMVCSSLRDITERKQAEIEIRRAKERAEEATKAKAAFLANMSHEIRTPMNGILGMTELALDTDLTAEQRDYLNTVKSSGDALLSIINDILDFSKIEAGRIELDPVEFLLRDSISDTLSPLALRAGAKKVELAYDVSPDVPDALIGDVNRLRQVIVNLAGNAIKFTEKGEVVIGIGLKERHGDDVKIEVRVRDTGIGISPEAAGRLFKAFEQAEASTTRKYGGTGLGLAISKQLVELMGGEIVLESTPGVGSTFTFSVNFKVGTARPSTSPEDAARVLKGKTVLVVDDNATNRRILNTMLGHWGLSTLDADSGPAALAALDRSANAGQAISLVISDLHMPDMDGFELARAIRNHPRFGTMPIMMLTSSAAPGDQATCVELGVAARLLKPAKQSLLLDNVMRVLGSVDRSRAAAPVQVTHEEAPAAARRTLRVLLAEDNPVNQKYAIRVLQGAGHEVVVANNGREAVEKSAAATFDVVLMDVQMPEMDGLAATRAIRERESGGGSRLPIIAMTANAMTGDREMCLEAGMDGYVPKPVKKDALFTEVDRVLMEASRAGNVQ